MAWQKISPGPASAVVTHYNIRPAIDIYATTQGRDLGGVASDVQKILDDSKSDWGKGVRVVIRGQVETMNYAYHDLFIGLGFAIVLIYLLIVVNFQSWLDPFIVVMALPMALAGIVWMLFITRDDLVPCRRSPVPSCAWASRLRTVFSSSASPANVSRPASIQ